MQNLNELLLISGGMWLHLLLVMYLCTCCVHWGGVTLERGVKPVWTPWGNMGSNIGSNTHWTTHKSQTTLNGLNVRRTKEMVPNVGGRPPLGTANLTQGGEHGEANEFLFQYFLHSCHSGRNPSGTSFALIDETSSLVGFSAFLKNIHRSFKTTVRLQDRFATHWIQLLKV